MKITDSFYNNNNRLVLYANISNINIIFDELELSIRREIYNQHENSVDKRQERKKSVFEKDFRTHSAQSTQQVHSPLFTNRFCGCCWFYYSFVLFLSFFVLSKHSFNILQFTVTVSDIRAL